METHLTVKEVSALLYELASDTEPPVTVDELRIAMKVLSFLITQPDVTTHAATLPGIIARADEANLNPAGIDYSKEIYQAVSRFSHPMSVFCESGMAYMSLNLATSQNDPWAVY